MNYNFSVTRRVSRDETVELVVSADSAIEASKIAADFGNGGQPAWPSVQRYSIVNYDPIASESMKITLESDEAA